MKVIGFIISILCKTDRPLFIAFALFLQSDLIEPISKIVDHVIMFADCWFSRFCPLKLEICMILLLPANGPNGTIGSTGGRKSAEGGLR